MDARDIAHTRDEVLEEAAKACEALARRHFSMSAQPKFAVGDAYAACAATIRALKATSQQEGRPKVKEPTDEPLEGDPLAKSKSL